MKILDIEITPPNLATNDQSLALWDEFFVPIYKLFFQQLNATTDKYPHIDFDLMRPAIMNILGRLTESQIVTLRKLGEKNVSAKDWENAPENKAMMVFLWNFPIFANLLQNIHLLSSLAIKSTEIYNDFEITPETFVQAKQFIDKMNFQRWTRQQTDNEKQSGVSNLGGVSETLLELAMTSLIDGTNFFKTSNQKVQSYGDFVLMCLPNNLWLSVKSNFARERLLASGYTTDILGVGFFTSKDEFTSQSKIRNFQRVGFLAMYLPDIAVSDDQVRNNTNTFQEVVDEYSARGAALPLNINGTSFLRPLSQLHSDLKKILDIADVKKRTTLDF